MVAVFAAASLLAAGFAAPAQAKRDPTPKADRDARQLVELVEEVAPGQGGVVAGKLVGDQIEIAASPRVSVGVPLDPTDPIELDSTIVARNGVESTPLAVALPSEVQAAEAVVAPDGSVVYEAADGGASAVVQALDDGSVRLQTISPDVESVQDFSYSFGDDVFPVLNANGTADLLQDFGDVAMTVGQVAPAWAFDADGNKVPTHYEVSDGELIQVIEPSADASYPVVADPKVTNSVWNLTWHFNKKETGLFAAYVGTASGITALIPHLATKVTSKVAFGYAAAAGIYAAHGKCLKLVTYTPPLLPPSPPVPQPYAGKEAGGYCK
jgi:hypothetical protein